MVFSVDCLPKEMLMTAMRQFEPFYCYAYGPRLEPCAAPGLLALELLVDSSSYHFVYFFIVSLVFFFLDLRSNPWYNFIAVASTATVMSHMNGHGGDGRTIFVLYRIVNSESDAADTFYNCFQIPYGSGPTLSLVKQHCAAAHSLSHLGPEGYHWRVLVEDKPGASGEKSFSWWDIQDGNAKLPVKETAQGELRKLLFKSSGSSGSSVSSTDTATKAAKGAFKMMAKAAAHAIGDDGGVESHGPPVPVLIFKLLDLVKLHDEAAHKHGGGGGGGHAPSQPRPRRAPRPAPQARTPAPAVTHARPPQGRPQPQRAQTAPRPSASAPAARPTTGNLMDFGDAPSTGGRGGGRNPKVLQHTTSSPSVVNPNETRAQRLKREQEARMKTSNRVWDDVDQRWVEVDPTAAATKQGTTSAPPSAVHSSQPKKKEIGIKLDRNNTVGKSAVVASAMNDRVNKMEENAAKAVAERRAIEAEKKRKEEEEDRIRVQLEPKIKAWSEEYGKKKQLRALLASLHTILWPGAKWKPISIGDIMVDAKVKRFYLKATLVVHPDKTHDLPADQRFLAKRIFDALAQAKSDFDNGKN